MLLLVPYPERRDRLNITLFSLRRSFDGKAGPIQKFVKAVGDSLTLGATAIVVEEDNGGIFCPLVGSGDPIPRSAACGCETKSGTQLFLIWHVVQGFRVQWPETINRPAFCPRTLLAGLLELEADGLNGGLVLVQLQKSLRQQLAQFAFDGVGLRIQQAAKVCIVCGLYLIWCWTRAKPCNDSANPRRDKEQHSSEDEGAKHDEQKLVHTLMILQRGR